MSATVEQPRPGLHVPTGEGLLRIPLWSAVLVSRLLVLTAGATAALLNTPATNWGQFDPGLSSQRLGHLGNVLAASVDRWDAIHYLQIAEHGYQSRVNTAFYPLYPLLIRIVSTLTLGSYVLAGVVVSGACFGIALVLLYRLTVEELGIAAARATILLLAFAPLSFFFTAIYTGSLFLMVTVGAFYAARRERWALAALLVAAATATRVPGAMLIAPIAYMWWHSDTRPRAALLWLSLSILPLLAFSAYLDLHGFGLLASFQEQAHWGRTMRGPILTVFHTFQDLAHWLTLLARGQAVAGGSTMPFPAPVFDTIELVVLGICLAALVEAWRRLPRAYAIYAGLVLAVCLSDSYQYEPLGSFDRFALTIFPLWMIVGQWAARRRMLASLLLIGVVALIFYTHEFASWTFVA